MSSITPISRKILLAVILLLSLVGRAQPAQSASYDLYVDNETDYNDAVHWACTSALNDCSLRAAITRANTDTSNSYKIHVPAGTYTLSRHGTAEYDNNTGDLNIRNVTDLIGAGPGKTILDGDNSDRVMEINESSIYFAMHGMTIQNGNEPSVGGGGIVVSSDSFLYDLIIINNTTGGNGGGIWASNDGALWLATSLVSNNIANNGGGIYGSNDVHLQYVTLSDNHAHQYGGGLATIADGSAIANSTLSNNSADTSGGGIYLNGSTTLNHTTIHGPSSPDHPAIAVYETLTVSTSILSSTTSGYTCFIYSGTTITSGGYNLASDSTCNLTGTGDHPSTDPRFGPIQMAFGFMPVYTLLPDSLAIDGGIINDIYNTDQRFHSRKDGDGDGIVKSDIGAFEYEPYHRYIPLIFKTP
jgi:predicted outer membrane repeat protein